MSVSTCVSAFTGTANPLDGVRNVAVWGIIIGQCDTYREVVILGTIVTQRSSRASEVIDKLYSPYNGSIIKLVKKNLTNLTIY